MQNFKVGSKVKVQGYSKIGTVSKVDSEGNPVEVIIGDEVINVVNKIVELVGIIKLIIDLIKSIFRK